MDFSIGEDRQMLVDTLSRYLADKADWKAREAAIESDTGFDKAMWQGMAELGILGALFGEEVGGFGGSPFDIGVVFGEVGKALPPGPFLATLMAGKLLEAAGDAETLGNVIAGASIATFAHEPAVSADGSVAPQASASGSGDSWTVSGAKGVVDYLGSADVVVVTADTGNGLAAFLVETGASGVEIRDYPLVDGGAAGELTLSDAPARLLTDDASAIDTAIAAGLVATAWEAAAVMEVLRDETLEYLRTRKQFGIPIGKFQALQHRMATVALEIEQARSAAINAAANFGKDAATRDRFCSAAKYTVGKVGRLAAEEAIQMHGGIGMTWELPLSHYAKRLTMLGHVLGEEDEHLARFIELSMAA
ncbi:MAG: acyl-CoA dehydrogenase family protein [Sphingomonadaceae bacterium]|nr:acyl-CoA dehydrogenase family protein [Sphingomonadaceae bacterium]MCP5391127.1 acyl-CoA dehydrogenase family protein [Sphingomonadaceae bacterium]MCP5393206.1 acyl-CoA dehydrogenase family protein [Sphingomonadaceae bacterium]